MSTLLEKLDLNLNQTTQPLTELLNREDRPESPSRQAYGTGVKRE